MTAFVDSESELHEAARQATGLDDFGDDLYLEGLRALLHSLDTDARLTQIGESAIRGMIVGALEARLHSERGFAEHPSCASAPIERPLVIIGLARTGTSALHHLLSQDASLQGLDLWLAQTPKPRPAREQRGVDADFQACDARMRAIYERSPEMLAIHRPPLPFFLPCKSVLVMANRRAGRFGGPRARCLAPAQGRTRA